MGVVCDNKAKILVNVNTNNIYINLNNTSKMSVIQKHQHFQITNKLKIETEGDLSIIYSLPNLHKDPIKFRFITGAYNSSVKSLALELCCIFSHLKAHFINANIVANNFRTIKTYWSINNSNIIQELSSFDSKNVKLYSADFVDMFTILPHATIIIIIIMLLFTGKNEKPC